jgi:hypothetical protein
LPGLTQGLNNKHIPQSGASVTLAPEGFKYALQEHLYTLWNKPQTCSNLFTMLGIRRCSVEALRSIPEDDNHFVMPGLTQGLNNKHIPQAGAGVTLAPEGFKYALQEHL